MILIVAVVANDNTTWHIPINQMILDVIRECR